MQPPAYSVTDLGKAVPNSIDSHGTVTGSSCDDSSCAGGTFTVSTGWTPAPVPSGAASGVVVMGIDALGRVAMNALYPAPHLTTYPLPFISPPLQLVPILATDAQDFSKESRLVAMNAAGHLVGYFGETAADGRTTGGSYFYDGAVTRLAVGSGGLHSQAAALNSRDQVVGWMMQGSEQHAFLWDRGALRDLGTVSGANSAATGINDSGVVVGWSGTTPFSGKGIAFRWDGEMHPLGCPSGTIHCQALAINGRGDIVGEALVDVIKGDVAFLHRDGVFYRLDDLVQGAPGWHFDTAVSLNDAGQIAGTGALNGKQRAFLLTPR